MDQSTTRARKVAFFPPHFAENDNNQVITISSKQSRWEQKGINYTLFFPSSSATTNFSALFWTANVKPWNILWHVTNIWDEIFYYLNLRI